MFISVEFFPDTDIMDAISRAKRVARLLNCVVKFTFHGVSMQVYEGKLEQEFLKDYTQALMKIAEKK